jgi:hypothetical protein
MWAVVRRARAEKVSFENITIARVKFFFFAVKELEILTILSICQAIVFDNINFFS